MRISGLLARVCGSTMLHRTPCTRMCRPQLGSIRHHRCSSVMAAFSTHASPGITARAVHNGRTIPPPIYLQPARSDSLFTIAPPGAAVASSDPALPAAAASSSSSAPPRPSRDLRVTFLGTSSGRPTMARNVSSAAVWMRNNNVAAAALDGGSTLRRSERVLMFDCGDGTLLQSLHVPHLRHLQHLDFICLTHMHGDHAFGLPNVIASVCNNSYAAHAPDLAADTTMQQPLHVFGPQGISAYVKGTLAQTRTWMERPIIYHEILKSSVKTHKLIPQPDVLYHQSPSPASDPTKNTSMQIYEDSDFVLHAGFLAHRELSCLGYVVTEKPLLPTSSLSAASVSPSPPRKLVLLGDTCDSSSLHGIASSADLLVHEATFLDADVEKAQRTGHSTVGMAGAFARTIAARHLCLTHFSKRYLQAEQETGVVDPQALEQHRLQAQAAAGEETTVHVAQDFLTLHILARANIAARVASPIVSTSSPAGWAPAATATNSLRLAPVAVAREPLHIAMPKHTRR